MKICGTVIRPLERSIISLRLAESIVMSYSSISTPLPRSNANARALNLIVEGRSWLDHLAVDPATRSTTSVCLTVEGADADFIKKFAGLLEAEHAAYDIASYRDAPPGLRIWCGATVDTADIEALGPWLDWAWASLKN